MEKICGRTNCIICAWHQPWYNAAQQDLLSMNEPVLLLNANFEPLNVCPTRRALGLIFTGKAEIITNGRGYVRTVNTAYPRPSIIRLGYMIKRPRPRLSINKREILRRDEHTCQYCGSRSKRLTVDHVLPRHRGGQYTWTNLVTACADCNVRKGGRTIQEAHMQLLQTPFEPQQSALYRFGRYLPQNSDWGPFLTGW
jgi:5-methylcytosine-specific restriction endonuclease McrA